MVFLTKYFKDINENLSYKETGDLNRMTPEELRIYINSLTGVVEANDNVKENLNGFLADLKTKEFLHTKTEEPKKFVICFETGSSCQVEMDFTKVVSEFEEVKKEADVNKLQADEKIRNVQNLITTCIKNSGKSTVTPK